MDSGYGTTKGCKVIQFGFVDSYRVHPFPDSPRKKWPSCPSLRVSNEHRRSIKLIRPTLLVSSLWEGYPCWSKCGRRTRPFSGRAFREHRTNMGALPISF
jgi:hypothetical protein